MMRQKLERSRERRSKCSSGQLCLFAYIKKRNLANETLGELKSQSIINELLPWVLNGINLLHRSLQLGTHGRVDDGPLKYLILLSFLQTLYLVEIVDVMNHQIIPVCDSACSSRSSTLNFLVIYPKTRWDVYATKHFISKSVLCRTRTARLFQASWYNDYSWIEYLQWYVICVFLNHVCTSRKCMCY